MQATYIQLTDHSRDRAKERLGIRTADKLGRYARLAWERGMTADHADFAWQRKFITMRETEHTAFRLYCDTVFIFSTETAIPVLITVYTISHQKANYLRFNRKTRCNSKKHMRYHPEPDHAS